MRALFPKSAGRAGLVIVALVAGLAYWLHSPHGGLKPIATRSPDPAVISGSFRIEGPYFSDQDRSSDRVIAAINQTRSSLDVAVYSITQPDIVAAIASARRRGVRVRIVSDEGQSFDRHSEIPYLRSLGVAVRLSEGFRGQHSLMHDKFAVFDSQRVETGSYNWTTSASYYNFENTIFIIDPELSARYAREFQHLWAQAR